MADQDVQGHLDVLQSIWLSPVWNEFWSEAACDIESFERLGIAADAPDAEVWRLCQERGIVLITGNRNAEGEDSLEMTLRRELKPDHLPVFTISDPNRLMRDRDYAERVAARIIEYLHDLERSRGAGRFYLP